MKEQSLVMSFEKNPDDTLQSGIAGEHAVMIKNTFPSLGDKANSYFAYEKMEMFVHGGDPDPNQFCTWCSTDTSEVDLLFRIGKDDNNYYEIRQSVYEEWDSLFGCHKEDPEYFFMHHLKTFHLNIWAGLNTWNI